MHFAFQHFSLACLEFVFLKYTNTSANCELTASEGKRKKRIFLAIKTWNFFLPFCFIVVVYALPLCRLYWFTSVTRFKIELFAPNRIHSDLEFKWAISFSKNLLSNGRFGRYKKCSFNRIHSFFIFPSCSNFLMSSGSLASSAECVFVMRWLKNYANTEIDLIEFYFFSLTISNNGIFQLWNQ